MHNNITTPDGWNIKSNSRELQSQLHGNILPRGYTLYFSENGDFSESQDFAVDVPDYLQKTAKPGFVFVNKATGASLQKGQDGIWRKIQQTAQKAKQKAKQFVGKFTGKKQKPPAPFTPDEEYDPEYLPPKGLEDEEDEGPARLAPEKLIKNMKPEITDKDVQELEGDKELQGAISQIGENIKKAYAGELTDEEKKEILTQTKKMALMAGKKMALKTGETPEVIAKTIMKEGQREFLPDIVDELKEKAIQAYQQLLHKMKEAQDSGAHHMKAYQQYEPYSKKFVQISDQIKKIQEKIGGDESFDDLIKGLKEEGLKAYQADNLKEAKKSIPEEKDEEEEEENALSTQDKEKHLKYLSSLTGNLPKILGDKSISVKGPLTSYLGDIKAGLLDLIPEDNINQGIENAKSKGQGYKDSIAASLEACYGYLNNSKESGDPMANSAIDLYKDFYSKIEELGLEDYLPSKKPWEEEKEPELQKQKNLSPEELYNNAFGIQKDFLGLLGPNSLSIKNGVKKDLEYLQQVFFEFLDEDSLDGDIEDLKNAEPFQKAEVKNKFVQLGKKVKNMRGLGDPNAEEAINKYKEMIKSIKDMGLEDFVPKIREKTQEVKPEPDISEEEKNYGYMLDPNFKYEPKTKFEDLSEKWRTGFEAWIDSSQGLIDRGELPDIYKDVTAESIAAMRKYTGTSYTWMNNIARGKADPSKDPNLAKYDYMLGLVDQGLQQMRMQPPEKLHRGVGSAKLRKALSAMKPGETIYDHGYFSASSSKGSAQSFEGWGQSSVMFTINNAQGYYVDNISECRGEEERIFPRGSSFKIISMKELPNGQLAVEMEHILSDSEKEKYQKQIENQKQEEEENKPKVKIPESIDESVYDSGKALGGSTGAKLVDINGTKFVVKMGANEEQNYQEQLANSLYQSIGAKTSNSGLSEMGGKKVVVSEYIPGKDLGDQNLDTPEQIKNFGEQIIKGHAIDALVNNRDVFGLNFDNIRIGDNGEVYRIDNGGSFDTKATGGKKPYDGVPLEFFSMLERGGGKEFYHDVPIRKAYNSLNSLFENINELKEIGNNQVPENLRKQYFLRLNNLREIKDCWDFARSSNYGDDQECHEALKRYVTELHKKDPNDVVSYVGFKKFLRSI